METSSEWLIYIEIDRVIQPPNLDNKHRCCPVCMEIIQTAPFYSSFCHINMIGVQGREFNLAADVKNPHLVSAALDEALDVLGQTSKKALLFHLHSHSISLYDHSSASPFTLEQLHAALQTTLGPGGAELIINYVLLKMDELSSKYERWNKA